MEPTMPPIMIAELSRPIVIGRGVELSGDGGGTTTTTSVTVSSLMQATRMSR